MTNKKVLFIAYLFPPALNSGTQRSQKFAKYLNDFGWEPYVLTVDRDPFNKPDRHLLNDLPKGLRIFRVPLASDLWAKRISNSLGFTGKQDIENALEWRLRKLWKYPDLCAPWINSALSKAIRLHQQYDFDLIYASGAPWSSFLLAEKLSAKINKPFVLDYRDLWTQTDVKWKEVTQAKKLLKFNEEEVERRVINNASGIVSVCDPIVEKLKSKLNSGSKVQCTTIHNGFDRDDFISSSKHKNELFTICYTGVWKSGYTIETLFSALKIIENDAPKVAKKMKLITAGYQVGKAAQSNVPDYIIEEKGPLSHDEAVNIMINSDLLYLPVPIGEYSKISLPGKMFEYLATGNPILSTAPLKSEVNNMLIKTGGAIFCANEPKQIAKEILNIFHNAKDTIPARNQSEIEKLERRNLTKQLAELFNKVSG